MINKNKLTLAEHFKELKQRIIDMARVFLLSLVASDCYVEDIYSFILKPLSEQWSSGERKIIYTNLAEIFFSYLKLAYYVALFITIPFLICQIYIFIAPGLYKKEKKALFPFLIVSPILFIVGACFVYYFIFPLAWKFFLSFEQVDSTIIPIKLEAKVSEYLSVVINLIIAFGIAFQLPVLLVLLARLGFIDSKMMKDKRKFVIVIAFVVAAFLTPPDAISQIALALVLLLLYELSIVFINKIN